MAHDSRHGAFPTTHASLVKLAGTPGAPGWREAWEAFFRSYWQPLYAYLRRTGSQSQDALDLLQDFFVAGAEGKLLARFDPQRGRLRTFLLTCLQNDRRKAHRRRKARPADVPWISLEDAPELEPQATDPEEAFERDWVRCIQARAIAELRRQLATDAVGLRLLNEWVLSSVRPPAPELARDLGLSSAALYTRATRLRQALVAEVERSVAWLAAHPRDLEQERDAVLRLLRGASP